MYFHPAAVTLAHDPDFGAQALGHPLGGTGAKLMTTLIHELHRDRGGTGHGGRLHGQRRGGPAQTPRENCPGLSRAAG